MFILRAVLAVLIAWALASTAQAAVVSAISGQASIMTADGTKPIDIGTQLQPGQRVMASRRSTVTISFAPDCEITVFEGESYRIPEEPQCEAAAYTEGRLTQADQVKLDTIGLWVAGAGILAGIIIAVAQSGGGSDDAPPASP